MRYTVPQSLDIRNMNDQVVVRFGWPMYIRIALSLFITGMERVSETEEKVLAPGEMEQVILKKTALKLSDLEDSDLYGGRVMERGLICIGCHFWAVR